MMAAVQALSNEDIYNLLKQSIIRLDYPPGTQLSENDISKKFNVSRTPIKAIFTRLESEGFLNVIPQKGTYVSFLDYDKIKDFIYMRLVLEVDIVNQFFDICTNEDIKNLTNMIEDQKENFSDFFEKDSLYHGYIFDRTGHTGIWNEIQKLQVNYTRFRMVDIMKSKYENLILEHTQLLTAIINKDIDAYKETLNAHLNGNFNQTINSDLKKYFIWKFKE